MSFLLTHGHQNAECYPIGKVLIETRLTEEQVNRQIATEAIATQTAIASVLSKKGQDAFKKLIKRLGNDG